ncbi:group-specific protein [Virgibacillus salexigens]|uniref:Group-specific protein n=1 Tax=Virgibacillus kapii TaxID=1638645 RepID=A0ABQ2DL64_9BACI|nr:group-specific protein [Virgibacillus kapii]GGJ61751.1 hypothetical protein GCM10007111_24840 [Virgibacillus kapii]
MLQVQVDEEEVRRLYQKAIKKKVEEVSHDLVFWDTKELKRRTCLSWNTIQDTFFFDERFPKMKVGSKWLFPARETEKFLNEWMDERKM